MMLSIYVMVSVKRKKPLAAASGGASRQSAALQTVVCGWVGAVL